MKKIFLFFVLFAVFSCVEKSADAEDKEIEVVALNFGNTYFNLDLHGAMNYCTPAGKEQVKFLASNLTQADLDVFNEASAQCEVEVEEMPLKTDSTATVILRVEPFVELGGIGQTATLQDEGHFCLRMMKSEGKWLVETATAL